ncbi:MAG: helix-turn-helix domain-containing protein [Pseudobutyrivibrio sp.]|nr:helix-turn-helix domain-containing protein [Pseudobutyrivibrio sp.]
MNNKHLTFEERSIIEDLLNKGEKIHKIAKKLGRPDSSIVREVLRNSLVFLQAGNNTQLIMTIAVNMSLQGLSIINLFMVYSPYFKSLVIFLSP